MVFSLLIDFDIAARFLRNTIFNFFFTMRENELCFFSFQKEHDKPLCDVSGCLHAQLAQIIKNNLG